MTIDKKEVITIPKWLIILMVPIIFGAIGGYAASRSSNARQEEKVYNIEKEMEKKANQSEFEMVQTQLNRIENKLDRHISNTTN